MVTKTIRIDVNDKELDGLNSELKKTKANIDNVEGSTKKADAGLKKVGDNGGAIATLDSVTGGLATRIRDAAEATKVFNFSLKGTRTALLATGIGALVIALGLVVAYWDDILDFIKGVNARLQQQIDYSRRIQENLSFELELLAIKEKILKAEGKSTDEILAKRKQIIQLLQSENKAEIALLETQQKRLLGKIQEVTLAEALFSYATGNRGFVGVSESENEKLTEITEGIKDAKKQALELELQIAEINNPNAADDTTRDTGTVSNKREKVEKINPLTGESYEAEMQRLNAFFDATFDMDKRAKEALAEQNAKFNEEFLNSDLVTQAQRTEYLKQQADKREAISEAEADARMMLLDQVGNATMQLGSLIGQETAAGKGLAVAGALINTYAAIAGQLKAAATSPGAAIPGYAIAQSIATGLAGFAAVKNILSVKVPGQGGGGGSFGGGTPARPPAFNVVGNNPQNQLNQSLLAQNTEPVQAFVVDKQVTTGQELRRNKIGASSL